MERKILATAIGAILALSAWSNLAHAQDQGQSGSTSDQASSDQASSDQDKDKDKNPTTIDAVVVTGSLIPTAQKNSASPVTTITAEDIKQQGFRNVSDVLRAQPLANGSVQDNQFTNGFTPNATTIRLLGLDPDFTLILLDGRPLADYPLLYNGQSNFTDLSSIPTAMVDRIDILPGNQSAIYGSAAIAGVVNIILKKNLSGLQLAVRGGGYSDGGGSNERLQLTGGKQFDKLDITYGLQYSHQKPIWGYQRPAFDSTNDNPDPTARFGSRTFLILDGFTGAYIDPGAATCAPLAGNFGGTTQYDFRPDPEGFGRFGNYCGSRAEPGYSTVLNGETGTTGYLNASFRLNDNAELYGVLLYGINTSKSNSGSRFWSPDVNGSGGYVFDDRDGSLNLYQRIFSPEEVGGFNNYTTRSHSYSTALGIRGSFGDSHWDYDAYYSRSAYDLKDNQLWPLTGPIEDFFRNQFLGPELGTYYGYPVYHPDQTAFYQSLTPAQYASFLGDMKTDSKTWTHDFTFQVTNTDLFELPAGSVGLAALVQGGYQTWSNPTDPAIINGDFWGITGTQGSGKRSSDAVAAEFRIPIFKKLTANISARYDQYKNIDAGSDSKPTYKLGLEFRPMDTLLIRGNYATAFRAPDMAYIYAGDSGFFTSAVDYYRCALAGEPVDTCQYNSEGIQGARTGNRDLKSITAKSFGYGFVWSPNRNFDIRADYYHVNVSNEVSDLSIDKLLQTEAQCRLGQLDINSPTCVDALARIERNPPNAPIQPDKLQLVHINPINVSNETVSGIVAGTTFRFDGGRYGKFDFGLDYNVTLKHLYTQFPGDDALDYLHNRTTTDFKTVLSGDVTWMLGKWTTSVHGTRYGRTPNYTGQLATDFSNGIPSGTIGPYMLYNLTVDYKITNDSALTLAVNNVFNSPPPRDPSYTDYPYYNIFNYNGNGRAISLEYTIDFGSNQ